VCCQTNDGLNLKRKKKEEIRERIGDVVFYYDTDVFCMPTKMCVGNISFSGGKRECQRNERKARAS
jgi:hypothetical protein